MNDDMHAPASPEVGDVLARHQALVDRLKSEGHIRTPLVESAFRAVPRHVFVPGVPPDEAYQDEAIVTKRANGIAISSSSQPTIMAIMLEQLALEPGHRVLEIGAGTGYNAALMAHIVGEAGKVVTVDMDQDIVDDARRHLAAAGFDRVQVVCGDGGLGYAEAAPYDRIVLTVGAWDIAPPWLAQLKPVGRLLLPLALRTGALKSVAFERSDNHLASVSVRDCGFIMLRGVAAGPETVVQLGPEPGPLISTEADDQVDLKRTYQLLAGPGRDWPTGVQVTSADLWGGLGLWLAINGTGFCRLWAEGTVAERGIVPSCLREGKRASTIGLLGERHLSVLMRPPGKNPPTDGENLSQPFELFVRAYGPDEALAHRLVEHVAAWDAAGRPSTRGLRIRALPRDAEYLPSGGEVVIEKRWTRLVLDWHSRGPEPSTSAEV
jgi:protein-L-isoaspartate(D-aspartate) O-methyltransferase